MGQLKRACHVLLNCKSIPWRSFSSLSACAQPPGPLPRNESSKFSPSCAFYCLRLLSFLSSVTIRKEYCKLPQWNEDQAEKFGDDWIKQLDYKVHSRSWATKQRTINGCRLSRASKGLGLARDSGNQCVSRYSFPTVLKFHFPPWDDIVLQLKKNSPKLTQHSGIPPYLAVG